MKLFIATSILFLTVFACKNPEQLQKEPEPLKVEQKDVTMGKIVTDFRPYSGSAPTGISEVSISGNIMTIQVKYTGGCREHDFQLVGHKMISKSLPAKRSIKLFHDAANDDCRQVIEEVLTFDITSLATGEPEIIFVLDGYADEITYKPVH